MESPMIRSDMLDAPRRPVYPLLGEIVMSNSIYLDHHLTEISDNNFNGNIWLVVS